MVTDSSVWFGIGRRSQVWTWRWPTGLHLQISGLSWSHTMLIIDRLLISCLTLHLKWQTCRSHPSLSVQWHYVMKPQDLSVVFEHTVSVQSVLHMLTCVVEVFRHVSPGHCSSAGSCRWDGHPTAGLRQHPLIFYLFELLKTEQSRMSKLTQGKKAVFGK